MVERVLVNLLTNSMNALIHSEKEISIETQYLNNRTVIKIQDSRRNNDKIQDKIFLPFSPQDRMVPELA
jgi:phosphoglycerate-specific signal transduction histidine kinase